MDKNPKFCADCEYYKPDKRKRNPSLEFVKDRAEVQKRFARPSGVA